MSVKIDVDGYHGFFSDPNTSHLEISLNQTRSEVLIPTPEGLVILSNPIALQASIFFPSEILLDPLRCQSHIRDELSAVLGIRLPSIVNAALAVHLVSGVERLDRDAVNNGVEHNNMFRGYDFSVDMEIVTDDHTVDAVLDFDQISRFFVREDGLLDEEVTNPTSTTAIEKLKAGRFVADTEKEDELGNCCICLEEMCGGKELVGLPNCKHVFHENCVLQWLDKANTCPVCRIPLED